MNIIVILAGGSGLRFGQDKPKQYHLLKGKQVIEYVYDAALHSMMTDKIIIVSNHPLEYNAEYAFGGATHNESVKNAIDFIKDNFPECEKVLFLDSARPFITSGIIDCYFKLLDENTAVITTQHITDSLGKNGESYLDRSDYYLIQKPEGFRFELLKTCFNADSNRTAIIQQLPEQSSVYKYYDYGLNMKITYPDDLVIAEQLMSLRGE